MVYKALSSIHRIVFVEGARALSISLSRRRSFQDRRILKISAKEKVIGHAPALISEVSLGGPHYGFFPRLQASLKDDRSSGK